MTVSDKLKAWQSQYQKLLNVESPWNEVNMSDEAPVEGPAIKITPEMVSKVISKIKFGKGAGPSGIIIEMITNATGDGVIVFLTSLFNRMIHIGRVSDDWYLSYIINLFKGKGETYLVEITQRS